MRRLIVAALLILVAGTSGVQAADDAPLTPLCIDPAGISVSGISSGGFMAHQFHIAHSARIMGAGVIAGGPYACAGDNYPRNLLRALNVCSAIAPGPFFGPPDPQRSIAAIRTEARDGGIDDPAGLRGDRIFLFSARQDSLVPASIVDTVKSVYSAFGSAQQTAFVTDVNAPHAMLTTDFGNACETMTSPFINACGFDLAGATLQQIYGPLAPPKPATGELRRFTQTAFVDAATTHGMGVDGFVYVPKDCAAGQRCRLHIAFHGCGQSADAIGDTFARHAGYNGWAEANNIVVLYPQAAILTRRFAGITLAWPNPQGCWDWWGYSGPAFARKDGPQIKAVNAMIDRLEGIGAVSGSSTPAPACATAGGG